MNQLIKINEVTTRYDVTARTLHYYEKMGLIHSSRDESSGYRLYDETAIVRLKQILILRKMNISIADIGQIFSANNSDAVLSVLDRKVDDIDNEVAHLHELKEIVLEFIHQMRQADFHNASDIKMLFDKAVEIETSLVQDSPDIANLLDTSDVVDEQLTSIAVESQTANSPHILERFEVVKNPAYRFIGKAVYVRNDWGNPHADTGGILGSVWSAKKWIFSTLDEMADYIAPDMPYAGGVYMWDKYDEKNRLQGYKIGKFMRADTPVPDGMDYFDIDEGYIAKGWGGFVEGQIKDILRESNEYNDASWSWGGDVFADYDARGDDGSFDKDKTGYFIACTKAGR
ncbi:MAG: MerR family transcriptional regulator [Oscillospiraceae bacterium]|nr:MerR family transcriptional regulator [Oscillospiraceae bacterium]